MRKNRATVNAFGTFNFFHLYVLFPHLSHYTFEWLTLKPHLLHKKNPRKGYDL
jgi:uncharacterized membrane protein (DUF485 family)